MSDLQCPARILVARFCARPDVGVFAATLADRLAGERIAAVYAGDTPSAGHLAAIVADRLGLTVRDLTPGSSALEMVADTHRGESVLVLGCEELLEGAASSDEVVQFERDADGWRRIGPLSA